MLHLDKPLVFFDLETTGVNIATDRIIEISLLKLMPDQSREIRTYRVNPGIPIPPEATLVHGISDEDVRSEKTFSQLAPEIRDFIGNADLGGYNSNKFDVPLLVEEFLRADIGFDTNRHFIDVMRIFMLMEKRDLKTAYQFYCHTELQNAHSAEADTIATFEIMMGQLDRYGSQLQPNVSWLHEFTKDGDFVDTGRRLYFKDGIEYFNFGKYKDKPAEEVYRKEPQYFDWIINNEFPQDTKLKLKMIRLRLQQKNN
jgi:DNA polymerase-3 subunit epsilon